MDPSETSWETVFRLGEGATKAEDRDPACVDELELRLLICVLALRHTWLALGMQATATPTQNSMCDQTYTQSVSAEGEG